MTENLVYMILGWLFVAFAFGFQTIMYRHGDRSLWSRNKRNPLFAIEGWATLFSGAVLYAILRTWLMIDPTATIRDIPFVVCLFVCQVVIAGSLYLHWKYFPDYPSFFGWRDSRQAQEHAGAGSSEDVESSIPAK